MFNLSKTLCIPFGINILSNIDLPYQNTEISEYGNISGHLTKTVQLSLIGNHSKQTFYIYDYD